MLAGDNPETYKAMVADGRVDLTKAVLAETGWLVEWQNDGPCWWGRTPEGEDAFGWTKDSLKALRFARKEDAEAYIEETGWNDVVAIEHQWQ